MTAKKTTKKKATAKKPAATTNADLEKRLDKLEQRVETLEKRQAAPEPSKKLETAPAAPVGTKAVKTQRKRKDRGYGGIRPRG